MVCVDGGVASRQWGRGPGVGGVPEEVSGDEGVVPDFETQFEGEEGKAGEGGRGRGGWRMGCGHGDMWRRPWKVCVVADMR